MTCRWNMKPRARLISPGVSEDWVRACVCPWGDEGKQQTCKKPPSGATKTPEAPGNSGENPRGESFKKMPSARPNTAENLRSSRAKKKASYSVTGHRDGQFYSLQVVRQDLFFPPRAFQHVKAAMQDTLRDVLRVALHFGCFLQRTQARHVVIFY